MAELTADQEFERAQRAFSAREYRHAASHLSAALAADPLRRDFLALADQLWKAAPGEPYELLPPREPDFFGDVALRAWLRARSEDLGAIADLVRVAAIKPEVPYLAWAEEWAGGASLGALDGRGAFDAFAGFAEEVDPREHPRTYQQVLDLLAQVRRAQPDFAELTMLQVRMLRKAERLGEALELAEAYERTHPSVTSAASLGTTQLELGSLEAAVAAFRRGVEREPEHLEVRLDLADTLLSLRDEEGALAQYQEVLRRVPLHAWAHPSALAVRAVRENDKGLRDKLLELARAGNERAQMLAPVVRGAVGEPWVDFVPQATEATIDAARKLFARGQPPGKTVKLRLSALEAPSAVRSLQAELERHGWPLKVEVGCEDVQRPDPRVGRPAKGLGKLLGRQRRALWRYEGVEASPAVAAPPVEVGEAIAKLARADYSLRERYLAAEEVAPTLQPDEVAAALVHPPPVEGELPAWEWMRRCQVAGSLVLAESRSGRDWLRDVLLGPADWTVATAAIALAWTAEGSERPKLLAELLELLREPPSHGDWALEEPLLVAARMAAEEGTAEYDALSERLAGLGKEE